MHVMWTFNPARNVLLQEENLNDPHQLSVKPKELLADLQFRCTSEPYLEESIPCFFSFHYHAKEIVSQEIELMQNHFCDYENCKKLDDCKFHFLVVVWEVRRRLGKLANHKPEASDVQAFPHVNSPEYPSWVYYVANSKENVVYFKNYTILDACIRSQQLLASTRLFITYVLW